MSHFLYHNNSSSHDVNKIHEKYSSWNSKHAQIFLLNNNFIKLSWNHTWKNIKNFPPCPAAFKQRVLSREKPSRKITLACLLAAQIQKNRASKLPEKTRNRLAWKRSLEPPCVLTYTYTQRFPPRWRRNFAVDSSEVCVCVCVRHNANNLSTTEKGRTSRLTSRESGDPGGELYGSSPADSARFRQKAKFDWIDFSHTLLCVSECIYPWVDVLR